MSKEKNIPQGQMDKGERSREDPPTETVFENDAILTPSSLNPQPSNMEVHHHGHVHEKKKWKEYLFQFFMLFLAVFCGFLAEYQLEHTIENSREKQFIQTFMDDLKKDTAEINEDAATWSETINHIDSLRSELEKPRNMGDNALMYKAARGLLFDYTSFRYNDRTIQQLRSSGNFRLINRAIADSMIQYDGTARTSIRDRESIVRDIYLRLIHLQNSIFDSRIVARLKEKNTGSLTYIFPVNKTVLFQYYNDLYFYKIKLQNLRSRLLELNINALNIMLLIKKIYHME